MSDLERLHFYVSQPDTYLLVTSELWAKSVGEISNLTEGEIQDLSVIAYHSRLAKRFEKFGILHEADAHLSIVKSFQSQETYLSACEKIEAAVYSISEPFEEREEE
jgi:hypothetical protein